MQTKTSLSALFFFLFTIGLVGQNSIPNGDFESWSSIDFEYPAYYINSSNIEFAKIKNSNYGATKTTDAYQGKYALRLRTNMYNDEYCFFGFVINANADRDEIEDWRGGIDINEKPSGITGFYKYTYLEEDAATIIVSFLKGDLNIGVYFYNLEGIKTEYTKFDFDFDPPLAETPDKVIFAFASSNIGESEMGVFGSELILDAVSLKGISEQPAEMNGNFEDWEIFTMEMPDEWNTISDQYGYYSKTEDAYKGNYAAKIVTQLEYDNDNNLVARPDGFTTGYWNEELRIIDGGHPYFETKDTLEFWYKYFPSADDKAIVNINLRKEGKDVWGFTQLLEASDEYQHVEIIFNTHDNQPNNTLIQIFSTHWDNKDVIYEGSTLYIDEIRFKSQIPEYPTGLLDNDINNNFSLYPNPAKDNLKVSGLEQQDNTITIISITGETVLSKKTDKNAVNINISGLPKGVYLVKTNTNKIQKFVID